MISAIGSDVATWHSPPPPYEVHCQTHDPGVISLRYLRTPVVHALLGSGRPLRVVANRRFHILASERFLASSLGFDPLVFVTVPMSDVASPQAQHALLLQSR